MKQKYWGSPPHIGVPVSLQDVLRRKERKHNRKIDLKVTRFYFQGNFTMCVISVDHQRVIGVSKRMPGDKFLINHAKWLRELPIHPGSPSAYEARRTASYIEHKYGGDKERAFHGSRLAFSRALDNAMQGWC